MASTIIMLVISTMQPQKHHPSTSIKRQSHRENRISTYKPNIWKYDHLLSLASQYSKKKYKLQNDEKLKEKVSSMFSNSTASPVALLELVDIIDKFCLSGYFEVEIKDALEKIIMCMNDSTLNYYSSSKEKNIYVAALCFRLLREHGHPASPDMLKDLLDGKRKISDIKILLELLEGSYSYLSMSGENILDDIRLLATKNINSLLSEDIESLSNKEYLSNSMNYYPFARRVKWYDVRRHIIFAQHILHGNNTNPILLSLAKHNFNTIQATHQNDLKDVIRWWRNLCMVGDLAFSRDRIVESFFCAVGIASEPQHGSVRKWLTKVIQFILIIDDVYDIYGSLAEVQQFTRAIQKWDQNEVQCLSERTQICFKALHDTVEEISVEIQQQKGGPPALPYLKQEWVNFCKAMLVEATWYHKGYIPTLEEYLDNGWISSSGQLISFHLIFGLANEIEALDLYKNCKEIIYHSSLILRLFNDLGTSTAEVERGDVASSIICYMQEKNVSEDVARKHIKERILDSWKKINYHFNILSTSHRRIVKHVINGARMAHVMYYQFIDGFGVQGGEIQDMILLNLIEPIM